MQNADVRSLQGNKPARLSQPKKTPRFPCKITLTMM